MLCREFLDHLEIIQCPPGSDLPPPKPQQPFSFQGANGEVYTISSAQIGDQWVPTVNGLPVPPSDTYGILGADGHMHGIYMEKIRIKQPFQNLILSIILALVLFLKIGIITIIWVLQVPLVFILGRMDSWRPS